MKMFRIFLFALAAFCASLTYAAQSVQSAKNESMFEMLRAPRSFTTVLQIIKASTTTEEFSRITGFLKSKGFSEQAPVPDFKMAGDKVEFVGLSKKFDLSHWAKGEMNDGHTVFRMKRGVSFDQNFISLFNYISNQKSASLFQLFVSEAIAQQNPVETNTYQALSYTMMASSGFMLAHALVGLGAAASIGAGVALVAVIDSFIFSSVRMVRGDEIICVNGKLYYHQPSTGLREEALHLGGALRKTNRTANIGVAEKWIRDSLCKDDGTLKKFKEWILQVLSVGVPSPTKTSLPIKTTK